MAGAPIARSGTPSACAMRCASVVLPMPGGPEKGRGRAPRRVAAPLDEDLEVVDDLGLADVLVEAARAQRRVVLEPGGIDDARPRSAAGSAGSSAAAPSSCFLRMPLLYSAQGAQRRFYEIGDAGAGMRLAASVGGALGLGRFVAEVDERGGDRLRAGELRRGRRPRRGRRTCRAIRERDARRSSCRCRGSRSGARGRRRGRRRRARRRPSSRGSTSPAWGRCPARR